VESSSPYQHVLSFGTKSKTHFFTSYTFPYLFFYSWSYNKMMQNKLRDSWTDGSEQQYDGDTPEIQQHWQVFWGLRRNSVTTKLVIYHCINYYSMIVLDIWARGTCTARIFDCVQLSGQKPWRRKPTRAKWSNRLEDQGTPQSQRIWMIA
jgi:hypothetical protein